MVEGVRILIVEDSPADAELMELELRRSGLEVEALVVAARDDVRRGWSTSRRRSSSPTTHCRSSTGWR